MQGDFFQLLRRVQKEERKSSLSRVDNDFYKQLREYIRDLERSVANDPFGNDQLLLNNALRIATDICERRESKITKAANNNIYRSFLLFKKDNPQFDLLDTTPLNLTDEEETLYFSLMDALKNHRYRISLDEYAEGGFVDDTQDEEYEGEQYDKDFDEDGETSFVEDSYESSQSVESESPIDEELEDEISNALGESDEIQDDVSSEESDESDEVLDRLSQIKDAKVVTDEKYEHIDRQVANQKYPPQRTEVHPKQLSEEKTIEEEADSDSSEDVYVEDDSQFEVEIDAQEDVQHTQESKEEVQSTERTTKRDGFSSDNINDVFKDPDSQFVDLDNLEPNYDDDFYNAIAAGSSYAQPSEDDFNMIFAKPKKPKESKESKEPKETKETKESKEHREHKEIREPKGFEETVALEDSKVEAPSRPKSTQSELGFSSGLDVKEKKVPVADDSIKAVEKEDTPKKPVDKTRGGLFTREEIENATVVISEDVGEMVGIDGKVYGPFLENDVVILPNITAQILIDNNKATLVKY